jgi:hypothetical protein
VKKRGKDVLRLIPFVMAGIFLLTSMSQGGGNAPSEEAVFSFLTGTHWMSIYLEGEKVGYSSTSIEETGAGDSNFYRISYQSLMRLTIGGNTRDFIKHSTIIADRQLHIRRFRWQDTADKGTVTVNGEVFGERLRVVMESGGVTSEKIYRADGDWTLSELIPLLMTGKGLRVGKTYSLNIFDKSSLDWVPVEAKIIRIENDKRVKDGKLHVVEENFSGITRVLWLDGKGNSWKEEISLGEMNFSALIQSREEALDVDWRVLGSGQDIVLVCSIASNVFIPEPRAASELNLVLGPLDDRDLDLSDRRQKARIITL